MFFPIGFFPQLMSCLSILPRPSSIFTWLIGAIIDWLFVPEVFCLRFTCPEAQVSLVSYRFSFYTAPFEFIFAL